MKTLFITGTDTHVGKTWIGQGLVRALQKRALTTIARKPVESGCVEGEYGGQVQRLPADAMAYAALTDEPLEQVCAYRLSAAISPARAAQIEGLSIDLSQLVEACQPKRTTASPADWCIVEGAGGFYSPLCRDGLNADLAQQLSAPVLLVVDDRLGCLNQALLSLEAIERRGLTTAAVVINQQQRTNEHSWGMSNADELQQYGGWPIWHTEQANWLNQVAEHLATNAFS